MCVLIYFNAITVSCVGYCVIARRAHCSSYRFSAGSNLTCCNHHASAHLGQKKVVSCKVMLQGLLNFWSVCCSNSYHFKVVISTYALPIITICCVHVSQQMCCFWMFRFLMCVPVLNAYSNISCLVV